MVEEAQQHPEEETRSSRNATAAGFIIAECTALDKKNMLAAKKR